MADAWGEQEEQDSLLDRYRCCATDDLAAAFADLGAAIRVLEAQRLAMLAVLDEREAWRADGARDSAGWVAQVDAVRVATGRAMVETARNLAELPLVAAVAAEGRLSADQLRPLSTVADRRSDARWAAEGPTLDPSQLEAAARRARRVQREQAEEQRGKRCLRTWRARGGGVRGSFYLPDADGEAVLTELDRRAGLMRPVPGEAWDPLDLRRADALVEACGVSASAGHVPAALVVHAQAGVLGLGGDGWARLADGTPMATETLRRLGCDATVQLALHDDAGRFIATGSLQRTVPRSIRRLLTVRDQHCRFPGCESGVGLHAHHIRFWSAGGPTELPNLVLLCHRHHALVHEGGWTLAGDPDDPHGLRFTRPDGQPVTVTLDGPSEALRARLFDDADAPGRPPPGPAAARKDHQTRCARSAAGSRGDAFLQSWRATLRARVLAEPDDDAAGAHVV